MPASANLFLRLWMIDSLISETVRSMLPRISFAIMDLPPLAAQQSHTEIVGSWQMTDDRNFPTLCEL